jgi:DNA-binding response OmpR family regulator
MDMAYKILVADDEADIVRLLTDLFQRRGYQVLAAYNGQQALALCSQQPDLILLDVNMPDTDGFTLCRQIRDFVTCPILFLTARIEDADKVMGFAAGGDDYILKPFSSQELLARVGAHLRREERRQGQAQVKFQQGLVIDYGARCVYQDGKPVHLAKKEFDIVQLLSMHPSQVFDRERIYESVWGWDSEGDSSVVAEHIRRVRAKFAAAGCGERIVTVWGVGYKWQ